MFHSLCVYFRQTDVGQIAVPAVWIPSIPVGSTAQYSTILVSTLIDCLTLLVMERNKTTTIDSFSQQNRQSIPCGEYQWTCPCCCRCDGRRCCRRLVRVGFCAAFFPLLLLDRCLSLIVTTHSFLPQFTGRPTNKHTFRSKLFSSCRPSARTLYQAKRVLLIDKHHEHQHSNV